MPIIYKVHLDYEGGELVTHVQLEDMTASLAAGSDDASLAVHLQHSLGVVALGTEDKPGKFK